MDADRADRSVEGAGAQGRLERALWIAVAVTLVSDVATTLLGLRLGLSSRTRVAHGALAAGGL